MTTFSDRLNQIIAESGLTKTAFAKRIEVSQGFVSQLTTGSFNPSARTISAICREFNVRREWLESGEVPMRHPEPETDMDVINDLLMDVDNPVAELIRKIYRTYKKLPAEDQQTFQRFVASLLNEK